MTIEREQIERSVFGILISTFGVDPERVSLQTTLVHDLQFDLHDRVDLIDYLEQAFHVSIPLEREASQWATIEDVVRYVSQHQPD